MSIEQKEMDDGWLAEACKALAHPARIRIFRHLIQENACICGKIVEILPLAQSTVSQHLKILKNAGLVAGEVEGPKTCYCVDKEALVRLSDAIGEMVHSIHVGRES